MERIEIAVAGGLPGIEEAVGAVFPEADRRLCCVHAVRNAGTRVRRSDCSEVPSGLKAIYQAPDGKGTEAALASFEECRKKRCPQPLRYRREDFCRLTAHLRYPEEVRLYVYAANQLEGIDREVKRRTETIEVFSSEESLLSVLCLVLKNENEMLGRRRLRGFAELKPGEEG